ncbi:MAG: hypothetical protein KGN02_08940 [bacterium]|nr:hypothetical protein [bacterium]
MKRLVALLVPCLLASRAAAQAEPLAACGGDFKFHYETTMASVSIKRGGHWETTLRSIMAVAPIVRGDSRKPLAWIVLDERGERWLATDARTPRDLLASGYSPNVDFHSYPNVLIHFTLMRGELPRTYNVISCSDVNGT